MLKARIIPCLDVKDGRTVKGVNFVDLIDTGDPVEQAKVYDEQGADELTFFDPELRHQQADAISWPSPACEQSAMGLYDQLRRLSIQA